MGGKRELLTLPGSVNIRVASTMGHSVDPLVWLPHKIDFFFKQEQI
jgi:hypothetical protein